MNLDTPLAIFVSSVILTSVPLCWTQESTPVWHQPGCHLVGFAKLIEVDDCRPVIVPVNACRGFCLSYSYPSSYERYVNGDQTVTTTGKCCSIATTHDVAIILNCIRNQQRSITIKSAATCSCSLCEL